MKHFWNVYILMLSALLCSHAHEAAAGVQLSPDAQFSILTCSPGTELYSLFGHTAIRVQDLRNGQIMDLVFNYGTFDYADDFYFKFAMGKLDYKLSINHFGDFQKEYIDEMRGIEEQIMLLNPSQKAHLWGLLQANYQQENQTYRYDFFYDNCATRVRDIILLACQLGSQYPIVDSTQVAPNIDYSAALMRTFPRNDDPSERMSLSNDHSVNFSYTYPHSFTFRQAIDKYLKYQPWSDFGIDVALGMPCDRTVLPTQAMFLPDSLKLEFHYGFIGDAPVVARTEDLLFNETEFEVPRIYTPFWIFTAVLLSLILAMKLINKGWTKVLIIDRIFLFICGMVGLLVVFLWFVTDHHGTVYNLNILWAHPLWLLIAFAPAKNKMILRLVRICAVVISLTLIGFLLLPQELHVATIPLMLGCLLICAKIIFTHRLEGTDRTQFVSNV